MRVQDRLRVWVCGGLAAFSLTLAACVGPVGPLADGELLGLGDVEQVEPTGTTGAGAVSDTRASTLAEPVAPVVVSNKAPDSVTPAGDDPAPPSNNGNQSSGGDAFGDTAVLPNGGDVNRDGVIDETDLDELLEVFGLRGASGPQPGDLDGDGDVDVSDLAKLLLLIRGE